jgi:hypothetical protein
MPSKKPNISELIDEIKGNKLGETLHNSLHQQPVAFDTVSQNGTIVHTVIETSFPLNSPIDEFKPKPLPKHKGQVIIVGTTGEDTSHLHLIEDALKEHDRGITITTNKRETADDLSKNLVDDSKAITLQEKLQQSLKQDDVVFHITNPYGLVEAIDEKQYYRNRKDYYLAHYYQIKDKQSKLSRTKRDKVVHIVETFILPNT